MWIIRLAITRPVFVTMIEFLLMVMGIIGYIRIGVDLNPKIEPPIVVITTRYAGAGPEEMETLISKPIEEQVNQIGGIDLMTSTSRQNISQIVIEFKLEVDAKSAQNDVRDRISRIRSRLPTAIDEPIIQRVDFADRPVLQLALTQPGSNKPLTYDEEAKLRYLADQIVSPRLEQVDGVGQIDLFGGLERQIDVELDLQKIQIWKVIPLQVANAIIASNSNVPAGEILEEPMRRAIRVLGEFSRVTEVNDTIVKVLPGGRVLRVSDLGMSRDSYKERGSIARVNGKSAVLLEIRRQSDANTVKVVDDLIAKMPEVSRYLPEGVELTSVYDGSHIIRESLYDVIETIAIAALLAILVVYFFLGSVTSTIITGVALPCTIIASFFALYLFDFTLNRMTLLGMSLSVGLILDDAIVVRENIWAKIEEGMSPREAALKGSEQVFIAVMATSATILATFLPITLIPGIVGKFFSAFALTVCLSVLLSTLDAVTMAPMLSAYMVSAVKHDPNKKLNPVIAFLEHWGGKFGAVFERLLKWSVKHPFKVLLSAALIFFGSLYLVKYVGFSFLPANENGEVEVYYEGPVGISINKTNQIAAQIEQLLKKYPELDFNSVRVGTFLSESNIASIYVRMVPLDKREMTTSDLKIELNHALAGIIAQEKLALSVRDAGGSSAGRALNAAIQGPDYNKLTELDKTITEKIKNEVPEITNLESSMKPGRPEVEFSIDRKRAAEYALRPDDVSNAIHGFYEGELAGKYREMGDEYDVLVRMRPEDRLSMTTIDKITVPNSREEAVPLAAVTTANTGFSPTKIVRINQMRAIQYMGDLSEGAPLALALKKFVGLVNPILPRGYTLDFYGQARSLKDLQTGTIGALFLGALFIYMVMAALYESFVLPFAILLPLPLAMVGAILALLVTGKFLDIYSMIGIIMLMGLVAKNAILIVDFVEHLRREGMERTEALVHAGSRRLRPIMMTTIAMVAGMIPVAIGHGEINKVRAGMGIASIGGLVSSTLLSLVVVPCAYIYLDNFRNFMTRIFRKKPHNSDDRLA